MTLNDIINIVLEMPMEHVVEDNEHGALISYACVLKAERHDHVVEVTHGCSEGSLLDIRKVQLNMVIAIESAREEEHRISSSSRQACQDVAKGIHLLDTPC